MKIGLFVTLEHEAHEDSTKHLRNLKEQVRAEKDTGFDSLWLPQHFVAGPSICRAAGRGSRDERHRYRDALGATEFRFRMGWPGLAQTEVLTSIARLGRIAGVF